MEFSSNMYIKEEIQDKPHDISAVTESENNSIRTKIVSAILSNIVVEI